MRIAVLSGGIGGARFLRGLLAVIAPADEVTVIANTADDIEVFGLQVCPDLDTVMYTLGGGIDESRGWGRAAETWSARAELAAYHAEPGWFGLGDRDLATHLVRTSRLRAGESLSQVTAALCERWQPGVRLLPMTDDRVETHIAVPAEGGQCLLHFQEYWIRYRARPPVLGIVVSGVERSRPAPGVLSALADADVILLPPSNPIVSIGTILQVPGIASAVRTTPAPVVGLSPIVAGAAVRGMADALLAGLSIERSAAGVALHYGSRHTGGVLDGWLVHTSDEGELPAVRATGITASAVPLLMTDLAAAAAMARAALDLAAGVS